MDQKLKARWVKALRSGHYKQCRTVAQDSQGQNCCLGVLGRIIRMPKAELIGNGSCAPIKESILDSVWQIDLSNRNDSGRSFAEIANYIEKGLKTKEG